MQKVNEKLVTRTKTSTFSSWLKAIVYSILYLLKVYRRASANLDHEIMEKAQSGSNFEINEIATKAHNIAKAVQAIIESIACPMRRK